MSLDESQRLRARFDGGKAIADNKSHLSRTATAMRKVVTGQYGLTLGDATAMRNAIAVMDHTIATLEKDLRDAKAIKKAHDDHVAKANKALTLLPLNDFNGVIAIAAMAGMLDPHIRMYTPIEEAKYYGYKRALVELRRASIEWLARDCALKGVQVAGFVDTIRTAMPAAAATHADLIRELNTLAVAEQMEKSA